MGKPLVGITRMRRTDAWYRLSKEEQDSLMAKIGQHREQVPEVKNIALLRAWDSQWDYIIIDEYPDMETSFKLNDLDAEQNWRQYWEGETSWGTKEESS